MSMWLVHIKKNMCGPLEHAQQLSFYLPQVSVWVNATLNRLNNKRGTALHEMVGLYAPQGVDLGGGVSP